jgi:signal transduction histidine kinase
MTKTGSGHVPIILNISLEDWAFDCLPGAFQRIIMNLVGNSLKYTGSGFIQIDLSLFPTRESSDSRKQQHSSIRDVVLKVSDSGKGISRDFLRNKLFSAFSQESVLAPGTGKFTKHMFATLY